MAISVLVAVAACTENTADDSVYEQGVDKTLIHNPNAGTSVDKTKISNPNRQSVDRTKISTPKNR